MDVAQDYRVSNLRISEARVSQGEKLQVSFVFGVNIETTASRNGMAYERTGVQSNFRRKYFYIYVYL